MLLLHITTTVTINKLIHTNYNTWLQHWSGRRRRGNNDQIPVRRNGKDLQLSNSSATNSTLNLRQMFPYANKGLSDKTSKPFYFFTPWSSAVAVCNVRQAARHAQNHTHTLYKCETLSPKRCRSNQHLVQSCAFKNTSRLLDYKKLICFYLQIVKDDQLSSFLQADLFLTFPSGDYGQKLLKYWDFEADLYTSSKLSIWNRMRVDGGKDIVKTRCAKSLQ